MSCSELIPRHRIIIATAQYLTSNVPFTCHRSCPAGNLLTAYIWAGASTEQVTRLQTHLAMMPGSIDIYRDITQVGQQCNLMIITPH